jgi:hypothetical protein
MNDLQENLPQIYSRVFLLLKERLQRGKMEPFYRINSRMKAWMRENRIKETSCPDWHAKYYEKTRPMPEGYLGLVYCADKKTVKTARYLPNHGSFLLRTLMPNSFYLEIPTEIVEKALALGFFP